MNAKNTTDQTTRRAPESQTIEVRGEVLEPIVHDVVRGLVRVRKRVESVPTEATVEATREALDVERIEVDRPVDSPPAPWQEGETLVIPVVEEVLVVEKRFVVREELRITRRRTSESVTVQETVRREVVEFEEVDGANSAPS